jgi:hypothetical protein
MVSAAVLTAAVASVTAGSASRVEGPVPPARLAIYYGIPSLVNGAGGDVEHAARVFAEYDVVVFGDGLQYDALRPAGPSAGPVEHQRTRAIIRRLVALRPAVQLFGYLPLGDTQRLSSAALTDGVHRWQDMGVHGIFLDEAGYDFGVTRARQNEIVDLIHGAELRVFANAFNPDDVLAPEIVPLNGRGGGNPPGLPARLGPRDLLLLESFVVRVGEVEPPKPWFERSRKAAAHARRTGVGVMTVTTTRPDTPFDASLCELAWWGSVLWGFAGFGWGEPYFGAPSSQLPPRACTTHDALGSAGAYVSDVTREGTRFVRRTKDQAVELDLTRRRGGLRPAVAATPPRDRPRSSQ